MRTRTALATALLALALGAAGCSSDSSDSKPAKSTRQPAAATVDAAAARQACVDAVAALPANDDGEVPSDPIPGACKSLSKSDYVDAYMDGVEQGNQAARDDMQACLDDPTCTSYPLP
jgi:hypothetical protein